LLNVSHKGSIKPEFPSGYSVEPIESNFAVDPNGVAEVEFNVKANKELKTEDVVNIILKTERKIYLSKSRKLSIAACVYAPGKVNIDGDLSEWSSAIPIVLDRKEQVVEFGGDIMYYWKDPLELSARIKTMWDDKKIYLAVEVIDNVFYQPFSDAEVWKADSIQIAIDPIGSSIEKDNTYEYIFALTPKGPQSWRYRANALAKDKNNTVLGEVKDIQLAVKRTSEGNAIYEAAIPISCIDPFVLQPGHSIGFTLLVNDADNSGRLRYIEWFSGIGKTKDPKLFGELTFRK
jgi:hypothetical protein